MYGLRASFGFTSITFKLGYLSGVIYGMQTGAKEWCDTFREWMLSIGFEEVQNCESIYILKLEQVANNRGTFNHSTYH